MRSSSKGLVVHAPALLALALYAALVLRGFWSEPAGFGWGHAVFGVGLVVLPLALFVSSREIFEKNRELPRRVSLALLVLIASLIEASGGVAASPLEPALYLLLALLASIQPLGHSFWNAFACGAFAVFNFADQGRLPAEADRLLGQIIFFLFFSLGVGALLRWERSRRRRLETVVKHLQSDRAELRAESVLGRPSARAVVQAEKSATEAGGAQLPRAIEGDLASLAQYLERSLYALVSRLAKISDARTCALYLPDGASGTLRLREAVSSLELEAEGRVGAGEGLIGWCLENGAPVVMNDFDPVRYRLPYYAGRQDVGSFIAVPVPAAGERVGESEYTAGVLCADAQLEDAFPQEQQQVFEMAASQVSQILRNARTLQRVHEEKREFEGLYTFSTRLSGSLRAGEIAEALLESAGRILSYDFGAVILRSEAGNEATVKLVRGEDAERVLNKSVPAKGSRAAWVMETGQTLPLAHRAREGSPLLFAKEKLPKFESAVILPFASGEREGVLGCYVLATQEERRLGLFEMRLLEMLAQQAGSAFLNARLYERMELLATTDGLTGLCNHRTFQERLSVELKRAQRVGTTLCLALTDIDHFKKFNDTYGHPVGDAVLKHLAGIFSASVREIDLVARYGGEEFVLVFPDTQLEKAAQVCDRLREKVARTKLRVGDLELSITISLGLAGFPAHASEKSRLIDCADKALYRAKTDGRNRIRLWNPETAQAAAQGAA